MRRGGSPTTRNRPTPAGCRSTRPQARGRVRGPGRRRRRDASCRGSPLGPRVVVVGGPSGVGQARLLSKRGVDAGLVFFFLTFLIGECLAGGLAGPRQGRSGGKVGDAQCVGGLQAG